MNKIHCNIDDLAHSILTYLAVKLNGSDPDDDECYVDLYSDMYISKDGNEAFITFDGHCINTDKLIELLKDSCIKVFNSEQFLVIGIHISLDMVDKLPNEVLEYI